MKPLTIGGVVLQTPMYVDEAGDVRDCNGMPVAVVRLMFAPEVSHLFAASPDLLLAAEQVVKESEPPTDESDWEPSRIRFGSALDNLRTAIARARGKES